MAERASFRLRAARFGLRVSRAARRRLGFERTIYVDQRVAEYRGFWEAAAERVGAEFRVLTDDIWEVRQGVRRTRIASHVVAADDPVTLRVAGDKALCYDLARSQGVPTPRHVVFTIAQLCRARVYWEQEPAPFVVKPVADSSSGLGIATHLQSWREIERAALLASLYGPRIMLERMVPAESCRLLFLDGRFLHAVRRRGVRVTGDGRRPVRALLADRGVRWDRTAELTLAAQGLDGASIPEPGAELVARCLPANVGRTRELRTIYDESITPLVGPALVEECGRVVRALGTRFAGVDIVTNDPSRSLAQSGGAFLEINTTPGIHHHYHTEEERRDHPVAVAVLRSLLGEPAVRPVATTDSRDTVRRGPAQITALETRKEAV